MHHLPRFFKKPGLMDRKDRRTPRLARTNAAKDIDYEAASSSSSLEDSTSQSLVTRSLDFPDRTSFRVEGTEGEFDLICQSLGLSGLDDFAIPAAAWEAMKMRSVSDILPRSKLLWSYSIKRGEDKNHLDKEEVQELVADILRSAQINDATELIREEQTQSTEFHAPLNVAGGGIKGVRPPLLKPPPSMNLPVVDHACSTWEILRNFAPESEERCCVMTYRGLSSDDEGGEEKEEQEEEEEEEGGIVSSVCKREEDETLLRIGEIAVLSASCSFTTSNEDDSSSTTTEPTSNISPNGRFRRIITSWQKGKPLGRGSFGSVYEGIAE